ncbi:MAG TPA: pyruvate, water dikinase regulatory protein [Thermomicrobiaceae bacterium]|nr:pyruvate, water dikinase regulatory protein [Thermomicrobiaceae bacterium]
MWVDEPNDVKHCVIHIVSDGSGATSEAVVDAATVQYPGVEFEIVRHPGVRTREQVLTVVSQAVRGHHIIVHTIVITSIRRLLLRECRQRVIPQVDLTGPLLGQISQHVGMRPLLRPGVSHGLSDEYFRRVDAIQYSVRHDDGQGLESLGEADIVLVGVSRSSKTPLSIYLSLRGWKVANIPVVLGVEPPRQLDEIDQTRVVGLMINKDELVRIRQHRVKSLGGLAHGEYADPEKVSEELSYCRRLIRRGYPWPIVDVTGKSVEESAKEIIALIESQRVRSSFPELEFPEEDLYPFLKE